MANFEKELAQNILRGKRLSAQQLGLRFDKVVVDVLADLRSFAEAAAEEHLCFAITISAPVRRRAATVNDLKTKMSSLLSTGVPQIDIDAILHGNKVRLRLIKHSKNTPTRVIGFVHNPESASELLLDLAEQWLLERGSPTTPPPMARATPRKLGSSSRAAETPLSGAGRGGQQSVFSRERGRAPVVTKIEEIMGGVIHDLPSDLQVALICNEKALTTWQDLTPIARNEWICWIETAQRAATRLKRISWACENLQDGKRRPCCWPGCPHRQRTTTPAR